jgi:hypothetical protein
MKRIPLVASLFAFAKGGSTLLNDLITEYCKHIKVPTFSLFDCAFGQGISTQDIQQDAARCFTETGYIFTGFRHFPNFHIDLESSPVIWLVRDPRDMLVSQYFSVLKSHAMTDRIGFMKNLRSEAQQLDIDQFVVNKARGMASQFNRYRQALDEANLKIYRYEDVIYKKMEWLTDMLQILGLEYRPKIVRKTVKQFDHIPDSENEYEHIRQVHPGNHKIKLDSLTIQNLNQILSEFIEYFDYEY